MRGQVRIGKRGDVVLSKDGWGKRSCDKEVVNPSG